MSQEGKKERNMATEVFDVRKTSRRGSGQVVPLAIHQGRRRIELGGVLIDLVDHRSAAERIRDFLGSGRSNQIVTVNLDFLAIAQRNSSFRDTLNVADLAVADGMPLVWLSRLRGQRIPQRLTGVELVDECCRLAVASGSSVFLLGAAPGVAAVAADRLRERFPGLRIAGVYAPPFRPLSDEENERILQEVGAARPDFLFVALGAPQQDVWIRANRDRLDVPVSMGIGCVLDLHAGRIARAPLWMQQYGLEWLFRLLQEPNRLWRRYIVDDLPMLARLGWQSLRGLRADRRSAAAMAMRRQVV
jgi:N-acetylglucosaminyldiphosphoundecaprenol N-acetyl-beta-D-mannosaminyltransferase